MTKKGVVQILGANIVCSTLLAYGISFLLWSVPYWANPFLYLSRQLAQSLAFSLFVAPLMVVKEIPRFLLRAHEASVREWMFLALFVSPILLLAVVIVLGCFAWRYRSKKLFLIANLLVLLFVASASVLGPIYVRALP